MTTAKLILSVPCALLLSACVIPEPETVVDGADEGPAADPLPEDDQQDADCTVKRAEVQQIFTDSCAGCHGGDNVKGGLGDIINLDKLITDGRIVRGDPGASRIFTVIESGAMPQGGAKLADGEIAALREWIDVCTADDQDVEDRSLREPPACQQNPPADPDTILALIRDDVVRLDRTRAETTRYFSFAHLHNAGYCEDQIDGYRHALTKLINHLSHGPDVVIPEAIDRDRTVFRIDLRDLGWDEATWQAIVAADPYAIEFESQDALDIIDLTGAPVFTVVGDWFIESASQPPLYFDILRLPETRQELEASLGIDVEANILDEIERDDDDVMRAGFQQSGVSENNRVIERHQVPGAFYRSYWLSYDFASNSGPQSDIFQFPLDFQEDGGEIIFTLPNGLNGYMITDKDGVRIDKAPIEIVHDKEHASDPEVVTGFSCMGCHSEGQRLRGDEIAAVIDDNTDFSVTVQEQVARLYGPSDAYTAAQAADVETFAAALARTDTPRLVGGQEPVIAVHIAFDLDLDLARVAAEFGLPQSELLKNVSELEGLDQIDRRPVDRKVFQDNFAANACKLNLGVTAACPKIPQ